MRAAHELAKHTSEASFVEVGLGVEDLNDEIQVQLSGLVDGLPSILARQDRPASTLAQLHRAVGSYVRDAGEYCG